MAQEYEVGYRKPSKTTRFKAGVSRNPRGRPKGGTNLATDLSAELIRRWEQTTGIPTRHAELGLTFAEVAASREIDQGNSSHPGADAAGQREET